MIDLLAESTTDRTGGCKDFKFGFSLLLLSLSFHFQGTHQIKNRQHGTVAVICVKMASVMGVTWILGIVANLKALSFLWYPFVVLNSSKVCFL